MKFVPEWQLLAAFLLDLLLGDPRRMPHPVRMIGSLAMKTEEALRKYEWIPLRFAGAVTVVIVVGVAAGTTWAVLSFCTLVHPAAGVVAGVVLLYSTLATKDLARHARAVLSALESGDLSEARQKVGMMVGRDSENLTEKEIAQATVESVAENTVDGVTAPLFYALLFGPVGAMAYKAVNTLDSTFGYKNERYIEFGWASAKLDDWANYLPARLTVPVVAFAAVLMRLDGSAVFRSAFHTARRHASPNAGYPEAAFAGALGVRLGGPRSYGGVRKDLPYLGITGAACTTITLKRAVRLMILAAVLFLVLGIAVRLAVQGNVTWSSWM